MNKNLKPLVVDLDGTLVSSDILFESLLLLIKKNFLYFFIIPLWLLKGIPYAKAKLFNIVAPNPATLPYRDDVISYIKQEKEKGRIIILATGSLQEHATAIAGHLGIFDEAFGTYENINLKGKKKAELLREKFGRNGFDYIGNSGPDIKVWSIADKSLMVEPRSALKRKTERHSSIHHIFEHGESKFKLIFKELRIYQWLKNLLLFLPILLAHEFELILYFDLFIAFIAFSLTASSVYIFNDLLDLESDRSHPEKKNRPLASGKLSIITGFFLFPVLLIVSFTFAYFFGDIELFIFLSIYFAVTTAYSVALKKIYILDLVILSSLYTLRLVAGGVIVDIPLSSWLINFSIFLFLSLASLKRYTEVLKSKEDTTKFGRGYRRKDANIISIAGIASGFISLLIFALYLNSPQVLELYKYPDILIGIIPLLVYWLLRLWIKSERGIMSSDPIAFTFTDKASYIVFILCVLLIIVAS